MIRKRLYADIVGSVVILAAAMAAGCGQSAPSDVPKAEAELADQKKIQELSKQGYDFAEISAIMKGEQPKPRLKKKTGSSRH
jgi:predicted small lipoprotein YifL